MEENNELINNPAVEYTDDNIRHLSDMEHVRTRPGMYIGKLGDGSHAEDGIYVLLKEIIDNSIDEFKMQAGKKIEIIIEENLRVSVRDYGRGIPQGKLIEAVSVLNTGGKYDSKALSSSSLVTSGSARLQRIWSATVCIYLLLSKAHTTHHIQNRL